MGCDTEHCCGLYTSLPDRCLMAFVVMAYFCLVCFVQLFCLSRSGVAPASTFLGGKRGGGKRKFWGKSEKMYTKRTRFAIFLPFSC